MARKLTTILAADVAGYTRLMRADEEATRHTLKDRRAIIDGLLERHRGRFFGSAGDSVLAEFAGPVDAVRCAIDIQEEMESRNKELSEDRRLRFRIGINIGDVMIDDDDLLGDGVNVAARLEGQCEIGGLCIAASVFEQVRHILPFEFEDLGPLRLKNIPEPVHAYGLKSKSKSGSVKVDTATPPPTVSEKPGRRSFFSGMATTTLLFLAGLGLAVYVLGWGSPPSEPGTPDNVLPTDRKASLGPDPDKPSVASPGPAEPRAPVLKFPDKPSIAVLPFDNVSDDPSQDYFADGLTEDLITDLSKVSGLFVIARNSVFTYKGKGVNVQQVARELGVTHVLEGSVRKVGDMVRINAQLIEGTSGLHLWAERYDGSLSDIFALQDIVTAKIVKELEVELTAERPELLSRNLTDKTKDHPGIVGAKKAIKASPSDPGGYLGLAEQLAFLGEPNAALQLISYAMRLDPHNPSRFAYALALAKLGNGNPAEAAALLRLAVQDNPDNVHLWFLLAASQGLLGETEAARDAVEGLAKLKQSQGIPQSYFTQANIASWGFKRQSDIDRITKGLKLAGVGK